MPRCKYGPDLEALLSELTSSAYQNQRVVNGSGWRNHGAAAVVFLTVRDPATYTAAFAELSGAMDNPGSVRLMEIRAGGMGTTHLAILTGSGTAAVNEYMDELLASDAFADFVAKVGEIRSVITASMFRRVKTYGD